MEKVDVNSLGIDTKLATKYNALVNFIKENTSYCDGCLVADIEEIEYVRENNPDKVFQTIDYIKMTIKIFDRVYTLWINNPKGLRIDRKYNSIDKVGDLDMG